MFVSDEVFHAVLLSCPLNGVTSGPRWILVALNVVVEVCPQWMNMVYSRGCFFGVVESC